MILSRSRNVGQMFDLYLKIYYRGDGKDCGSVERRRRKSERLSERFDCGRRRRKAKKECLEGESNSHLRITQAMLGHIDDRYETFVLAVILSRLDEGKFRIQHS